VIDKLVTKSVGSVRVIVVLAFLQVLCSTYFLKIEGFFAFNSILFLLSGIGISVCLLISPKPDFEIPQIVNKQLAIKILTVGLLLPVSYFFSRRIMDSTPLQIE
jgi:hypothetical protein